MMMAPLAWEAPVRPRSQRFSKRDASNQLDIRTTAPRIQSSRRETASTHQGDLYHIPPVITIRFSAERPQFQPGSRSFGYAYPQGGETFVLHPLLFI
jgi:hypothetical protein